MKKTFQLNIEGKHPDRVLEATKHEIRKYMQRQLRVALPVGVDYWDWDCKFGDSKDAAEVAHYAAITKLIDALVARGGTSFYLELVAKPGVRQAKPARQDDSDDAED